MVENNPDLQSTGDTNDKNQNSVDATDESTSSNSSFANKFDSAKDFLRKLNAGKVENPFMQGGTCTQCDTMQEQVKELESKLLESANSYKRLAADFENFRKRTDREREEYRAFGVQKALDSMLSALDDFDRAKSSINEKMDFDKIMGTINIVYSSFMRSLDALGVKPLDAVGKPFDPQLHEPVQEVESDLYPENHVIHELRKGYIMNEKVFRPSLVNVTVKPSENSSTKTSEQAENSIIEQQVESDLENKSQIETVENLDEYIQKKDDKLVENFLNGKLNLDSLNINALNNSTKNSEEDN